ncbi:hypothetical protein ILYODFUR_014831 [Ilyodon furcidens]|uniref:Uncharacterized protein n=1 Tax=Ilyodon furcidens TaxID=33524 RepID=A0ABV0V344_9TELE
MGKWIQRFVLVEIQPFAREEYNWVYSTAHMVQISIGASSLFLGNFANHNTPPHLCATSFFLFWFCHKDTVLNYGLWPSVIFRSGVHQCSLCSDHKQISITKKLKRTLTFFSVDESLNTTFPKNVFDSLVLWLKLS